MVGMSHGGVPTIAVLGERIGKELPPNQSSDVNLSLG